MYWSAFCLKINKEGKDASAKLLICDRSVFGLLENTLFLNELILLRGHA
jgi:hypothetical protein